MSTMGFITEQAPEGKGYALYSIALKDGALDKQVIAFKTTMVEISLVRASLEKDAYGTESLPPIQKEVHYLERPQIPQQPAHNPDPEGEISTLDKIKNAWPKGRAHASALLWFAILTVSYLGTRIA